MMTARTAPEPLIVLDDPHRLAALLPPLRRRILGSLAQADSATGIARRLGLARQKVNYHLRELEKAELVECVEERQRRGCVERRVRPTARAYVVSPSFLGGLVADPDRMSDRHSSGYLMAVASRTLRDVGVLRRRAHAVDRKLVTMTLETEVSFASPAAMSVFRKELTASLAALVSRYHKPEAAGSRSYRIALGGYPTITKTEAQAAAEEAEHARQSDEKRKDRNDERETRIDPKP